MAKILVVEDERDIRDLIAFTLRYAGFEVVVANNGAEALEKTQQEQPDLVILDVRMPKMTGYEVCRRLKADSATNAIPIVFLSAKGQEREIREGYDAGGDDYIVKPIEVDKLVDQMWDILRRSGQTAPA